MSGVDASIGFSSGVGNFAVVLAAELHTHSAASHDGRDPVDLLLRQAAAVDLDAIAITDHDRMAGSREAQAIGPDYGLMVIPGIEISTAAGHVIGLGINERIPRGLSYGETLDRIREQSGIAIIPHPFQPSRHGVAPNVTRDELAAADAIEVYNSRLLTGRANRKAEAFATSRSLPMTAGSDAHISEMVGQAVTFVDAEPSEGIAGVLSAIAAGETIVDGKRTPWRISLRQAAGGMRRRIHRRAMDWW